MSQASCLFHCQHTCREGHSTCQNRAQPKLTAKGQKALTPSKQRGIKQSAKHELEWGKIFHSIIWTDLITSKLPNRASSTDVSCRFATHPVVAQPFQGRNSLAVSGRRESSKMLGARAHNLLFIHQPPRGVMKNERLKNREMCDERKSEKRDFSEKQSLRAE